MQLIKLDAIDSTNDFLKDLSQREDVSNFTVVTAENQTKGKGQMGAVWNTEAGKNLTMSVLIKEVLFDINDIYLLNVAVALSVIRALNIHNIPYLAIKWPNDILSANKKIGGILIENSIKGDGRIVSVVGLGLNVNQIDYKNLPKASSLAIVMNRFFDKEALLNEIVREMEISVSRLALEAEILWREYQNLLYKNGIPMPFETTDGKRFMGIIKRVNPSGQLEIVMEDDSIASFEIKQIQMLY